MTRGTLFTNHHGLATSEAGSRVDHWISAPTASGANVHFLVASDGIEHHIAGIKNKIYPGLPEARSATEEDRRGSGFMLFVVFVCLLLSS